MNRTVLTIALAALLTGCASTGPETVDNDFSAAVVTLQVQGDIDFALGGAWFPNTILGDTNSFHNSRIGGRLFLTDEQLIFAVYDKATGAFLEGYSVRYSDIDWLTTKKHGASRIIRLKSGEGVHSFAFSGSEKEQVVDYVLEKVS